MADGRGSGAASSSSSSSDAATGRQGNPTLPPPLDGAFLLQLLQKPPQPASPFSLPRHHIDPAVAAVGPSHPFFPHDIRPPHPPPPGHFPESLVFPSPPFSLPQGLPPGLFPPSGFVPLVGRDVPSGGSEKHPFFPLDHQRLGFSTGGVHPFAASPPRSDFVQNLGRPLSDRVLVDQMVPSRKVLGPRGGEDRSSSRPPPGFQKLQDGGAVEVNRRSGSWSSDDRLIQQKTRSSWSTQRNHQFHRERDRNSVFQRLTMKEGQQRPLDHTRQEQGCEHGRRDGNHDLWVVARSQKEEDHASHSPMADAMPRRATSSGDSLEYEALEEENKVSMQKLEIKGQGAIVEFSSKSKSSGEEDELCKSEKNSVMLRLDSEVQNIVSHTSSSRSKDFRSDSFRGHHVSTQRMRIQRRAIQCRHDIEALNSSFITIFKALVPAEEEKAKQKELLLSLQNLVTKEWPNAKLHLYGSCANCFGVSKSDIDVCLAIDDHDLSKSDILLRLADILQSGNLQNVQALTRARVPIVKLMDPDTGLSCDICVNNLLAVVNTKLLKDYAQIDERLRQLAFIVKHWARSRRVNETYQGTLSSYAYVLMCIHFLQLRRPAILPCLQAMDATYTVTVENTKCTYFDRVEKLHAFGARNKESIARLLWGFFHYWAYHHDYTDAVISIRTGSIISKRAKDWTRRIGNDRHLICIEDPFDISHDLGRVVDKYSIKILREEFERAADILQYDLNPSVTLFQPYVQGLPQR
ncbi:hypothetical protein OPV22_028958 [Ensete ventricosum]|uniref:RNA uridylyltransferase n=1 Tax=Ensete ventricosum TaxID=4639 RepID=A0AAV8Q1U9_ENSVE|nr:hypothetical protein OPV22_028958 [Ensete ventricosum]